MENRDYKDVPENANEHCPGTQSESAGKSDACKGCPNQEACATAPKGPDPEDRMNAEENKRRVKRDVVAEKPKFPV